MYNPRLFEPSELCVKTVVRKECKQNEMLVSQL